MLRVLGRKTSGNVQKVLWLLEETSMAYARDDYGRQFNNTQTEAYLALNPNAKVPTLVDGDLVIWESNTILRYLAGKASAVDFYPQDIGVRTHVERWMDWQLASLNAPYLAVFKDSKRAPAERPADWAANVKELAQQLQILDRQLARQPWISGSQMTLADFCLAPIVHRCLDFAIDLPALDALRHWRARVISRPAFQKSVNP